MLKSVGDERVGHRQVTRRGSQRQTRGRSGRRRGLDAVSRGAPESRSSALSLLPAHAAGAPRRATRPAHASSSRGAGVGRHQRTEPAWLMPPLRVLYPSEAQRSLRAHPRACVPGAGSLDAECAPMSGASASDTQFPQKSRPPFPLTATPAPMHGEFRSSL